MINNLPNMHLLNSRVLRYLSISLFIYLFIVSGMYILVDWMAVRQDFSYIIIYIIAYVVDYFATLLLVFGGRSNFYKLIKFIIHTATFSLLGLIFFRVVLEFKLHYIVATVVSAIALMPLRYLSNKYLVYR